MKDTPCRKSLLFVRDNAIFKLFSPLSYTLQSRETLPRVLTIVVCSLKMYPWVKSTVARHNYFRRMNDDKGTIEVGEHLQMPKRLL